MSKKPEIKRERKLVNAHRTEGAANNVQLYDAMAEKARRKTERWIENRRMGNMISVVNKIHKDLVNSERELP